MSYIGLLLAAVLVGIDQLTKWLVVQNIAYQESVHLIEINGQPALSLTYYKNSGAAFSMFEGQAVMLTIVSSVIILALIIGMLTKKINRTPTIIASSLIIGGGLGNIIDRIFNGGFVVDFIDVRIINFAVFNFADMCAVCGGIMLVLVFLTDDIRERLAKRKENISAAEQPSAASDDGEN